MANTTPRITTITYLRNCLQIPIFPDSRRTYLAPNLHLDLRERSTQHSPAFPRREAKLQLVLFRDILVEDPPPQVSRRYPEPKLEAISFALLTLCRSLFLVELLFASVWPRGELLVTTIPELESTKTHSSSSASPVRRQSSARYPLCLNNSKPRPLFPPLQRRKNQFAVRVRPSLRYGTVVTTVGSHRARFLPSAALEIPNLGCPTSGASTLPAADRRDIADWTSAYYRTTTQSLSRPEVNLVAKRPASRSELFFAPSHLPTQPTHHPQTSTKSKYPPPSRASTACAVESRSK